MASSSRKLLSQSEHLVRLNNLTSLSFRVILTVLKGITRQFRCLSDALFPEDAARVFRLRNLLDWIHTSVFHVFCLFSDWTYLRCRLPPSPPRDRNLVITPGVVHDQYLHSVLAVGPCTRRCHGHRLWLHLFASAGASVHALRQASEPGHGTFLFW